MNKKRYVLELDLYLFADNDKKAIKKAEKLVEKMNKKYVNSHTRIKEIGVQHFGTMYYKKIEL